MRRFAIMQPPDWSSQIEHYAHRLTLALTCQNYDDARHYMQQIECAMKQIREAFGRATVRL